MHRLPRLPSGLRLTNPTNATKPTTTATHILPHHRAFTTTPHPHQHHQQPHQQTHQPSTNVPRLKITMFTRTPCGLCIKGKNALSHTWDIRPESFVFREVDVMGPEAEREGWKVYEFDTPVLHIEPNVPTNPSPSSSSPILRKLMHRFSAEDILREMAFVEKHIARSAPAEGWGSG